MRVVHDNCRYCGTTIDGESADDLSLIHPFANGVRSITIKCPKCQRTVKVRLKPKFGRNDEAKIRTCDRCKDSGEVVDIRKGCDMGMMPCPECKEEQ